MRRDAVLERLMVEIVAKTDGLETALNQATETARQAVREMEAAAAAGGQTVGTDLARGFDVARESTGQFTRELTTSLQQTGASTEQIAQRITQLNDRMRENHETVRAGEQSRAQYRQTLQGQRQQLQTLITEYNRAARGLGEYDQAISGAATESRDLDNTIKSLSNEVRTQRNLWAGRITDDEKFRQSTEALHREMRELLENTDLTGDQMRKLTQDMAYAQRGIDSVNNVASRGGLAWTAQIGIADALGGSLRNLGPAGNVAASGLRSAQMGFAALTQPINLADLNLKKLASSLGTITRLMPLLAAAAGTAAVAGLWRMTNAHAELANSIDLATYRTGLSVEAYQELRHAASQTGVDVSILDTTMQRLQRRAADAQAGNENLRKSFNQLGVSLTDADGNLRGTEDLLGQVADGLNQVENNAERLRLAFAVFDTEGGRLLPLLSQGSEGIAELRREARELGLVISGDTILSLTEFRNEVSQLQGQFQTATVEITAAFLPVLQDVLIPLIQNYVIPWIQNVATAVGDWADKFVETGEAGDEFRAQVAAWLDPLVRFGRLASGVALMLGAVAQGVLSAAATLGAGLGTFIAQLEAMRPIIDEFIAISQYPVMSAQYVAGMSRLLSNLSSIDITVDPAEITRAAKAAGQQYHDAAQNLAMEGLWEISLAIAGDSFTLELAETVRSAIGRGGSSGLSDLQNVPEVGEFSSGVADAVSDGVVSGIADGVARSLPVFSFEQPDEGAGGGLTYRPDERFGWDAERRAREAEREQRILEDAARQEEARLDRLAAAYRQHQNILRGAAIAAEALPTLFTREDEQAIQAQIDGYMGVQAQLQAVQAAHDAAARVAAANAAVAEGARLDNIAASHREFQDQMRSWDDIHAKLAADLALIDAQYAAFGDEIDVNALKAQAHQAAVNALIQAGFDPLAASIQGLISDYQGYAAAVDEAAQAELVAHLTAQRAAEQQAAVAATTESYERLLATINEFGVEQDPFDQFRAQLKELAATGHLTGREVADALNAIREARERVEVSELEDEFASLQASVLRFTGQTQSQFEILETAVQNLIDAYREAGLEVEELIRLLNELRDAQDASKAQEEADKLTNALRSVAADVDGLGGDFVSLAADMHKAILKFRETGEVLDIITVGLNAATKAVEAFKDGIDGGDIFDLATGIGATIATLIGGEQLGQFYTATMQFLKSFLGDMSNGIKEIEKQVDGIAGRSRYLSRDLVQSFADANTSRVSRGGFLGWLGFTKAAVDQEALELLTGIAESIGSGMSRAFNAVDVEAFRAAFDAGIDEVIQQQIIDGFILGEEAQAAIEKITFLIAEGDYEKAREEYMKLRADAEETYEQIQEWNRELGESGARAGADYTAGFTSALKGLDFSRDFNLGLDELIRDEIIKGFLEGEAISEGLQAFQDAIAEGDYDLAREIMSGLQAEGEEFYAWLVENFPELYDAGVSAGHDFASGIRSALQGSDFAGDFTRGLQEMVRDSLIDGFLESEDVQSALEAAREAYAAGNVEEARAIMETITSAGEAFWEQLKQQFPDLYEDLRAEELAAALRESADAVAQLNLEVAQSELDRAWAAGTLSLREYQRALQEVGSTEAQLAREQALRDLEARRERALAAAETEAERQKVLAQFEEEAASIEARYRAAIADAEASAIDAIKSILGVTTDGLAGSLRSAFDTSVFSDFVTNFHDSMRDTIRNALIAGFLESEAIKPLLNDLGDMIMTAILEGTMEAGLGAIEEQIDLIVDVSEEFWNFLEDLGFGFRDLTGETDRLSESIASATEQMLNVPSLFKFTQATWSAAPVAPGWSGGGFAGQSVTNETHVHVTVHAGDVVGINDFEQFVTDTVKTGVNQSNLATAGLGTGGGRDW